jgi:hypothetical protein
MQSYRQKDEEIISQLELIHVIFFDLKLRGNLFLFVWGSPIAKDCSLRSQLL